MRYTDEVSLGRMTERRGFPLIIDNKGGNDRALSMVCGHQLVANVQAERGRDQCERVLHG
jgi:hypothetical protein